MRRHQVITATSIKSFHLTLRLKDHAVSMPIKKDHKSVTIEFFFSVKYN